MNNKPQETHSATTPPPPQSSSPNEYIIDKPPPSSSSDQYTERPPPSSSDEYIEKPVQPPLSTSNKNTEKPPPSSSSDQNTEKWGTDVMGAPAPPSSHPNNQKAAMWSADENHQSEHPYVQHKPIDHKSPIDPVVNAFNSWSHKAETLGRNIWKNLNTGSSLSDTLYGKVGLTTKVLTGGGFEALYKQTFETEPNEKLKKTFACYMSTATGPVAGTLYLSNVQVAFCSDRPLSFTAPSGQVAWSYYKVVIPLAKIKTIDPINKQENPSEKYIQIATVDGHDFWFMGCVNYDKATRHLSQSLSEFTSVAAQPGSGHPAVKHDSSGHPAASGYPVVEHNGSGHPAVEPHGSGHPAVKHDSSGHPAVEPNGLGHPAASGYPVVEHNGSGHPAVEPHGSGHPAVKHDSSGHPAEEPNGLGHPASSGYPVVEPNGSGHPAVEPNGSGHPAASGYPVVEPNGSGHPDVEPTGSKWGSKWF